MAKKAQLVQCEMYVRGLLLNHKSMTGERLHNMLKMLSDATGGSSSSNAVSVTGGGSAAGGGKGQGSTAAGEGVFNYDMTLSQLRTHLSGLIEREIIEYVDGSYQLLTSGAAST